MDNILEKIKYYTCESDFPRVLDNPKTKCRLFRSTKPKTDKEKQTKKKKIAKKSKKINRRK